MPSQPFSTEAYFQTQRPPAGLDEKAQRMDAFVQRWNERKGRVVLVTSGGTTVPLESNTWVSHLYSTFEDAECSYVPQSSGVDRRSGVDRVSS